MALSKLTIALFSLSLVIAVAFAKKEATVGHLVEGSVSCFDCAKNYDYSGIKVLIWCKHLKKPVVATAKADGSYKADIAHDVSPTTSSCEARLLGGPKQLYASVRNMIAKVADLGTDHSHAVSTAPTLSFVSSCSGVRKLGSKCSALGNNKYGSSKTVDLPIPREYGLAPTSYYFTPILPIIGIP